MTADNDSSMVGILAAQEQPRTIRLRRELHRTPELSRRELKTAARIEQELAAIGLASSRPTRTSVVARLTSGRRGPALVLRADMDALPVQEATGLDFSSANEGVMHACGHDGHTAVLLSVARILTSLRSRLCGEVRFLFQHAEESLPSGAPELIECGVLDGADAIIGHHLWSPLPTGRVAAPNGPLMASTDYFDITIKGRGGHAGIPQDVVDPVAIGAQVVTNLQHVVSRETDPLERLVVSVTGFHAGEHHAIVPDSAVLHGTVRAFSETVRQNTASRIEQVARGVAASHGAQANSAFRFGPPAVVNDSALADVVSRAAVRQAGTESLEAVGPLMVGEDFAWYQEKLPGVFFLVGAGFPDKRSYPHHHPQFDIDENSLSVATRIFVDTVLEICAIPDAGAERPQGSADCQPEDTSDSD